MTKRVFLRDLSSGEPAALCGDLSDPEAATVSIGHCVRGLLEEAVIGGDEDIELRIEIREMSDAEVGALPEL